MDEQSAEEAARAHASSVVAGDIGSTVRGMTPEGLAKAMQIGNTSWIYFGYELTPKGQDGDDYLFDMDYKTDLGLLSMRYRFRCMEGEWKVVDTERIGDAAGP